MCAPSIILALGNPSLLSLSTNPPTRINDLPLTPATAFYKALITTLSGQAPNLRNAELHIAEPPVGFPRWQRDAVIHATQTICMKCRFYTSWECVNAILPCALVLDVTRPTVLIYDAIVVEASSRTPEDVAKAVAGVLRNRDLFDRADARIAVVGALRKEEIHQIVDAWTDVVAEHQFVQLASVQLRFVACDFDNSVLVWVGAAVLAAAGGEHGRDIGEEDGSLLR